MKGEQMKIEKGIPIPKAIRSKGPTMKSALESMDVGDSVVIDSESLDSWRSAACDLKCKVSARIISQTKHRLWLTQKPGQAAEVKP